MPSIFSTAYCPFIYLLWRNLYSNPLPVLKLCCLLLLTVSSLCILDMNNVLDIWFANTFSHSVDAVGFLVIFKIRLRKFPLILRNSSLWLLNFLQVNFTTATYEHNLKVSYYYQEKHLFAPLLCPNFHSRWLF